MPAITVGAGLDRVDGGVASGKALRDAYFAKCYHQPCDAWTSTWNAHGQAQDVEILYALGREIADGNAWPHWLDGSEFRAARERSGTERE